MKPNVTSIWKSTALVVLPILILSIMGCDNPTSSDDSEPDPTAGLDDPTEQGDEVLDEIPNSVPTANDDGSTYTFQVRDKETDAPITSDVTVTVTDGTPTSVNGSGEFTITPDISTSEPTRFHVQVPGYDVVTFSEEVNDQNIIYKRPIVENIIGEWMLYEVWDTSNNEERTLYSETVTFREDGSVTWAGDRTYRNATYYYTAYRTDASSNVRFGYVGTSIPTVDLSGNSLTTVWMHGGLPTYDEDNDIFEFSTSDRTRNRYSRDGSDPFDTGSDDGSSGGNSGQVSGTLNFRGSSLSGTATSDGNGTWAISTSTVTVAVVNAPSSGTASLGDGFYLGTSTEPGLTVVQGSTSYISTSGSIDTRNGSLTINASVVDAISLVLGGGTSYSFTFTAN